MKKYQSAFTTPKPIIKDLSLINHEAIKKQLLVLDELRDLIPPLLSDENRQLEENIKKEGCREALLVWQTTFQVIGKAPHDSTVVYVLVDGHNRYRICMANEIDFKIHLINFESLEEVMNYMIDNQLGRRNLSPEQISYLRGLKYHQKKNEKGKYERLEHKGQNVPYGLEEENKHKGQNVPYATTAEQLAKQFNVSDKTIKRDADFAEGLNKLAPSLRQSILSGETKVKKHAIQQLAKMPYDENSIATLDNIVEPTVENSKETTTETPKRIQLESQIIKLATSKLTRQTLERLLESVNNLLNEMKEK